MPEAIKVEGLSEFRRNLKKLDGELGKALRVAFNDAAQTVVSDTRSRMPRRSGRAAGTVRARSTQTRARVSEGGNRAPYTPWLDFGGSVGRKGSVKRPFLGREGRYLYRSFFARRTETMDGLNDALLDVARKAGLEVS